MKPGEVEAVRRGGDEDDGSRRQRLASVRRARRPAELGEEDEDARSGKEAVDPIGNGGAFGGGGGAR